MATTKTAEDMYRELACVEEGGALYTLQRATRYEVEYVERKSRNDGGDGVVVYLRSPSSGHYPNGKPYRLVVDCGEDRFVMEEKRSGEEWRTHSAKFAGFRYRSPTHPKNDESWEYEETQPST
ncbi:hypothetical protein [Halorussus aquaticus]|uniref:Uncharacterized protein n=1 Tax=Halorussus aquaticus TaxID=2953748 RepID=A0ABD5QA41_9EURY|nr:hypothetical protein [Halorussus aquaticus]